MDKKATTRLTVTVDIETDCTNLDDIEAALCSALADLDISYDCEEEDPETDELTRVVVEGRIAIAATERCRVDSGVNADYQHPGIGNKSREVGDRTFVYNA